MRCPECKHPEHEPGQCTIRRIEGRKLKPCKCEHSAPDYLGILREYGGHKSNCFQINHGSCKCGWAQTKRGLGL